MSTVKIPDSWQERLAVINEFQVPNDVAVKMFNTSERELQTARGLVEKGMMKVGQLTDDQRAAFAPLFSAPSATATVVSTVQVISGTAPATKKEKRTAVAKQPTAPKTPGRRGRIGSKISTALSSVPTSPMPVDQFLQQYGVSKTILRQSKRFLETPIKVSIKRDKTTGVEMICRIN
jgi:hypothetical protein